MDDVNLEGLRPFALTNAQMASQLALQGLESTEIIELGDPRAAAFGDVIHFSNALCYGGEFGAGIPRWVMLDCAILPSAILGLTLPRQALGAELAGRMRIEELAPDLEEIPIAVYCACPTLEPGVVSGFSLFTMLPGLGLGLRCKAMALSALGARGQMGVTQFENRSTRLHTKLAPMELLVHRPSIHTLSQKSFVYRLELPVRERLLAIADGALDRAEVVELVGSAREFDPNDEQAHDDLRAHLGQGGRAWVVAPGWRAQAGRLAMIWSAE